MRIYLRVLIPFLIFGLVRYMAKSFSASFDESLRGWASWFVWGPFLTLPVYALSVVVARKSGQVWLQFWGDLARRVAHFGMGHLSFLFVLIVAKDLLIALGLSSLDQPKVSVALLLISGGCWWLGFWRARRGVRLKKVEVLRSDLPLALHGLRLVQVSDLHVSHGIRRDYVERVIGLVNSCDADLVVLTGDIVDGPLHELTPDLAPLSQLKGRLGCFYVDGNHEHYWGASEILKHLQQLGLVVLHNEHRVLQVSDSHLVLGGVPDAAAAFFGGEGPDVSKAFRGAPREGFRVLLSHQTKVADQALEENVGLLLSGHTHGGQFFPWTWVVSMIDRFPHGLRHLGKMAIYVSRGTGYWGPPLRLGSPSEVSLLILKPS